MKKQSLIFLFVMTMVMSLTAIVSAADRNVEFYNAIDSNLLKIYAAVVNDEFEEAKEIIPDLRQNIYECSRYLTEKGEYSAELMDIVTMVNTAIVNKSPDSPQIVVSARCAVAKVLLRTTPDFCYNPGALADVHKREPVTGSESSHS